MHFVLSMSFLLLAMGPGAGKLQPPRLPSPSRPPAGNCGLEEEKAVLADREPQFVYNAHESIGRDSIGRWQRQYRRRVSANPTVSIEQRGKGT